MASNRQVLSEESISHFYTNERVPGGIIPIGLTRRKVISGLQWCSNFIVFVLGIIGLVDICMASAHPDYYVYYTFDSAAAAGYPFQYSAVGWIPYLVLEICAVGFSLIAAILELRCYFMRLVGIDLKWDIMPFNFIRRKTVERWLIQAQQSFSPHGVSYDNYFYFAPLVQIVIIALLGLHLTFGFDVISFTPLFVVYGFCLFIILTVYMAKLFIFPFRELDRYRALKQLSRTETNN